MEYMPFCVLQRACFIAGVRGMRSQAVSMKLVEIFSEIICMTYISIAEYLSPQEGSRRECSASIVLDHLAVL